jgi:valyl-tRNA synthetase
MNIISVIRFFQQVLACKNIEVNNAHHNIYNFIVTNITKTSPLTHDNNTITYKDQYHNTWILGAINPDKQLLHREINKIENNYNKIYNLLQDKNFIAKADPSVVQQYEDECEHLGILLDCLEKLM